MRAEQLVPGLPPQLPAGLGPHRAHGGVEREDAPLPVEQLEGPRRGHGRTLPGELPDPLDAAAQRRFVEEVRSGVRDGTEQPVELVAAAGRVDEVADGDLVADDERRGLVAREQPPEGARVAQRGFVEALAAAKTFLAVRVRRRLPVGLQRLALELADTYVCQILVDEMRDLAARERDVGGLQRAREGRDG